MFRWNANARAVGIACFLVTTARLSDGAVVMDLEAGDRFKIRRSFRLRDEGPQQLEVTTSPAGGPHELALVTVYDTVK